MKKLSFLATAVGVALVSSAASADPYLGGKLGYSSLSNSCYAGAACDDSSFAGGVYAGYDFNRVFALEVGYDYLGDFKSAYRDNATTVTIDDDMTAYSLAPKLSVPIYNVDIFAKIGAAKIDHKSVDDVVLLSSLGTEVAFTDNLAGRFEYQRLNNVQDKFEGLDVNSFFLGLTYTFNSKAKPMPMARTLLESEPEPMPVKTMKVLKEFGTEFFATDSYALAAGSEQYFDELVTIMRTYPQASLSIVGHTDSVGTEAYNQKLSENRAKAVADYFISQGINASRISYQGMGELQPKASNNSAAGRKANRRVDVTIPEFEYQE